MRCPACGSALPDVPVFPGGSVQCACGGGAQIPPPPPSLEVPVSSVPHRDAQCPRCSAPLETREEGGAVVAGCPAHHGLFVTHKVLASLEHEARGVVAALDEDASPAARGSTVDVLACPTCRKPMLARLLRGDERLVVDECSAHGTWFDAGELQAALSRQPVLGSPGSTGTLGAEDRAALALESVRDENETRATDREVVELGRDLVDTFNSVVLGRQRGQGRYR